MANDTNTGADDKTAPATKAAGRGPSYPALNIEQAITKALQFWGAEKRGAAPISAAAKHWGYSETSSSGKVAVAALLHYGLMEDQGSSGSRTVKLTGRGLDIVLDAPGSPTRLKAVQDALLTPKLYADILAKWPAHELPSDQTLRYYLLREKSFNESSVEGFIKDLRASIAYAELDKPPIITAEPEELKESDTVTSAAISVESGKFEAAAPNPAVLAFQGSAPTLQIGPTEREWLRGQLSKRGVTFRLLVSGSVGSKEIGRLVKILEAQKSVLDDDDEEF